MKRPLALFALFYMAGMMAAVLLTPEAAVPLALTGLAAFFLCLFFRKKWGKNAVAGMLAGGAIALAVGIQLCYTAIWVTPVKSLAGTQHRAIARVIETAPGAGGGTVEVTLQVLSLDEEPQRPFKVHLYALPHAEIGEQLELPLRFSQIPTKSGALRSAAKNIFIHATVAGEIQHLGQDHTLLTRIKALQQAAGERILNSLPRRLSSVGAAMVVGDKRFLEDSTMEAYRGAGLSHMMVVSGLNLSLVCGVLYFLLRRLKMKGNHASLLSIVFVVFFMAFTGFTSSVVRSGSMYMMVLAAGLFYRKSDIYTSMGLAAVLLCTQNPFAVVDIGLLLSFTATLGALAGGELQSHLQRLPCPPKIAKPVWRAGITVARLASIPICVTIATLPVLAGAGIPVTIWSIPANILAVPFMPVILFSGFFILVFQNVFLLGAFAKAAALVLGGALVILEKITTFFAGFSYGSYVFSGGYVLLVLGVVYCLAGLGLRYKKEKWAAISIGVVLATAVALQVGLQQNTVKVIVAEGGANPSVVLVQNQQAIILYRGRLTAYNVENILQRENVKTCTLLVDLRQEAQTTEAESMFLAQQVVVVSQDVISKRSIPLWQVGSLLITRQGGGTLAIAEVDGWKIGVSTGAVAFANAGTLDFFVAGSGKAQGEYTHLLIGNTLPPWANTGAKLIENEGGATLWIRPGKSIQIKEAWNTIGSE